MTPGNTWDQVVADNPGDWCTLASALGYLKQHLMVWTER